MIVRFIGQTKTKYGVHTKGDTLNLKEDEAKALSRLSTVEIVPDAKQEAVKKPDVKKDTKKTENKKQEKKEDN